MPTKAQSDAGVHWTQIRGRNGFDAPQTLPNDMAAEVLNMQIVRGQLGKKRAGSSAQAFTGDSFSGYNVLANFQPGQSAAAAELHFVSRDATPKIMRVAAGTAADELTLKDAIASLPQNAHYAVLNGKLYWAYDSAVNRLHVFDPDLSTTIVRRVGLDTPGAPSVADTGSGGYADDLRYYRIQWLTVVSGRIQRQSNLGTAQSFTPSGSGTAARITQPTLPDEGETHWIVWGSDDDADYYQVSDQIAVATTTYDDDTDPASYSANTAAPAEGAYTPPPSAKYLLSTGDRLVMFGAYETSAGSSLTPRNGRVWFTPIFDTTDTDDDERVSNSTFFKGWIDVSRDASAEDRAICGPLDGQIFVFLSRGIFMLVPTTNAEQPFRRIAMSTGQYALGAVSQESTFMGKDELGRACVYFLDPSLGLYRYGANGFEWCGYDSQDVWARVNLDATTKVAHGVYDDNDKTVMMWVAVDGANEPNEMIVFHTGEGRSTSDEGVRYGHTRWTGTITQARCSVMFAETLGASMSRRLKPYAGFSAALLQAKDEAEDDDNGATFQAYCTSKAFDLNPPQVKKKLGKAWLYGKVAAGVSIQCALIRNFGDDANRTDTVSLAAVGSETRTMRRFEGLDLTDAFTYQARVGDSAAIANAWELDSLLMTVEITTEELGNNLTA